MTTTLKNLFPADLAAANKREQDRNLPAGWDVDSWGSDERTVYFDFAFAPDEDGVPDHNACVVVKLGRSMEDFLAHGQMYLTASMTKDCPEPKEVFLGYVERFYKERLDAVEEMKNADKCKTNSLN